MLTSVTSAITPSRPRPATRPAPSPATAAGPSETVELSGASAPRPQSPSVAPAALAGAALGDPAVAATLKVLSLNIWEDGHKGVDQIIELVRQTNADVIGLQESYKATAQIAEGLGFHHLQQVEGRGIVSRFPIEGVTPNRNGVTVRLDNGREVDVFNAHLFYHPYQPYQLTGIPYMDAPFLSTEAEAVASAEAARGADVRSVLSDVESVQNNGRPKILVGDFNEPSHLDWTQRAADAGRHPIKVEWPATKAFEQAGFQDSFRTLHPDEIAHPGSTWTPLTEPTDPKDHHDRIDFVLYQGQGIAPQRVDIVGENEKNATIVVAPYPTDHRGVLTTFAIS